LPDRLDYPALDGEALLARLERELTALGVDLYVEATVEAVRARVRALISGKKILSWDPECLPYGLGSALEGEKVCFGREAREKQGEAEIGLTGCEAALAETGTLAVIASEGRPRSASLLPYTHVAVIRRRDIVLGMGEFLARFAETEPRPYLVFVTGPSRTAYIELSLTLGVHGPGKVMAVLGP
jgi:L-lactate dehydrogenase complex protein LldG